MNLVIIGFDREVFSEGSEARDRLLMQAGQFESVHMIVFSRKEHRLRETDIGSKIRLYPTDSSFRFLHVRNAFKIGKKILRKIKEGETVISAQDPFESGLAALRLSKWSNLPLHVQIHTDFLNPYFSKGSLLNGLRVRIARYVLPHAKGIRLVSRTLERSLEESKIPLSAKTVVLPVYIETDRFSSKKVPDMFPQFEKVILSVARLSKEKDMATAIRAFKKIKEVVPGAGLVIVGDGPEFKKLTRLAGELNISSSVVFAGKIPSGLISSYYDSADLYIQASLYEGFGRTYVEAGLSGCPIVSTKAGIASEIGAITCPVKNVDCIAQSSVRLLSDDSEAEKVRLDIARNLQSLIIEKELYAKRYAEVITSLYGK